jgi:putative membrane protein
MIAAWPLANAGLNAASALCLASGFWFIRHRDIARHRAAMSGAIVFSALFLSSYLAYHAKVGNVRYQGAGFLRGVYFSILTSHTILAVVIVPLVVRTFYLASRGRLEDHRRWARWTLPLWFYVSVTGVVIYAMLY